MTYVVTESCIKCKYTDCVDVCPVDCFREGPNFLAIDPASWRSLEIDRTVRSGGSDGSLLSAIEPLPPGIAVQPVLLDYGPDAASIAWVGDEHGLDNFKRILARRWPVQIGVRFLPPLTGEALANRKTIAATARAHMLHALEDRR